MMTGGHQLAERRARASLAAGDVSAASRVCLDTYGPELYGFLLGVLDDEEAARCVYSEVRARVATDLGSFAWRYAPRTRTYAIAHHALGNRRVVDRPGTTNGVDPAAAFLTSTQSRRPAGLDSLRRNLSEEDRELLILRIDRGFSWRDLSMIAIGRSALRGAALDEALAREEAVLRRKVRDVVRRVEEVALGRGLTVCPTPRK